MTTRSIELRRTFAAPRERVFAAWCRPALAAAFLASDRAGAMTDAIANLSCGGVYD